MNLCSIASGSSGNCTYIGNGEVEILVDAGISKKRIIAGLTSIDVNPAKLTGILITHEHSDHISGLGVFSREFHIPIYGTKETILGIKKSKTIGKIEEELFHEIYPDQPFYLNQIIVNPFSISHDAGNPVCYTFEEDGKKVAVATDLGMYDEYIVSRLMNCQAVLLEANHDINMLQVGAYPYSLKRRILGEQGHLSNDNSGRLLTEIFTEHLKYIFLGHLSKENNYPDLAYETVKCELELSGVTKNRSFVMEVANRDMPSAFVSV